MKLAVFTVMLPDLNPEEAVKDIKSAGYEGVEWRVTNVPDSVKGDTPSFWGNNFCTFAPTVEDAQRAKTLSDQAGLVIPNIGTYISIGELEKVKQAISFANTVGSPHFRVGFGNFEGNYTQHFEAAKSFLADVISLAKDVNVKPLVEIHHKTIVPSGALAHRLVSNFSPTEVGIIHDAGNMVFEGFEDYRIGLELLGDYLSEVHIKNAAYNTTEKVWQAQWSPLHTGVVDFNALFTALKTINFTGWFAMEDFSQTLPSKEALHANARFIRDVWENA